MLYTLLLQKRKVCLLMFCMLTSLIINAQTRITGRVTASDDKQPVMGASVKIKGAATGAITSSAGAFEINAKSGDVLVVTYLGYQITEVTVGSATNYNLVITPVVSTLNEVVVTGYTSQRKKDITGAVSVVDVAQMTSIPSGSTSQLLQGQASGVVVLAGGQPGSMANIFIRGVTSFGNTTPLVIVDGVQAGLNDINPNDIASVQVLKDAGAASIYGVRGANGVIVITTKKGKNGAPTITYDAYYGTRSPKSGNVFNIMSPSEQASVYSKVDPAHPIYGTGSVPDMLFQGGYASAGAASVDPAKYKFDPSNSNNNYQIAVSNKAGTDWFHEIFKAAPTMNHTLSASGGTTNSNYLFSINYLNEEGTLIETFNKRFATRINTNFNVGKRIRIGENAYILNKNSPGIPGGNQNEGNAVSFTYRMQRFIPVHDIQGNYAGTRLGTGEMGNAQNPVALQQNTKNNRQNYRAVIGNVFGEIDLVDGLTARSSFGGTMDNNYFTNFGFQAYQNREGFNSPNSYSEGAIYSTNWTWTNTLNYTKIFGDHNVKLLAGTEAINEYGRQVGGNNTGLFSTDYDYLTIGNGTGTPGTFSQVNQNASVFSLFGRADYAFADKYLVGLTIRRDGSSRFGSESRFGVFPAVSLGWRVSQESFMKKSVAWLNDFKLRGSWGRMGSFSNVGGANAFSLYGGNTQNAYYPINGGNQAIPGFIQNSIGNPFTSWEENEVTNVGFDATILNSHLTFGLDVYEKKIKGLLFPQALPSLVGGASSPTVNLGNIKNTGVEVSAGYNSGQTKDFRYNIGVNLSRYKNEVVSVPGGFFETSGSRIQNLVRNQEGSPVGSFYGYKVERLFRDPADVASAPAQADKAPGRFKYMDVNGDGIITPDDRTLIGDPNPDFTYGINLSANYKQFDISTVIFGSQGNQALNYVKYWTDFLGSFVGGKSTALLTAWEPTNRSAPRAQWIASNPNATTPVAESANNISNSGAMNTYYLEDASFLKMRSLQLGYSISPAQLSKVGISKVRLYVQGANLFTVTKYSGIDPELTPSSGNLDGNQQSSAFGIDYGNYPNNERAFLFGLNVSF